MSDIQFKVGSSYTRDEIYRMYFDKKMPLKEGGNWGTGYVRPKNTDDLVVFLNINIPGKTGHDYPNNFNDEDKTIEWFGKSRSNSRQNTFKNLKNKKLRGHFFARWNKEPFWFYLGIGKNYSFEDNYPHKTKDGKDTFVVKVTSQCNDSEYILPIQESTKEESSLNSFAMEKYLEEFIVTNWNLINDFSDYELCEEFKEEKRGKKIHKVRVKKRVKTGEIDIFAQSKDKKSFLVIELKKGRTGDVALGQIKRYMGSIMQEYNLDKEFVRGLIIALKDDEGLKDALYQDDYVDFKKYIIKFELAG